jgi:hypothetical protein
VVAGEEDLVAVEQRGAAPGVAGDGDDQEVVGEVDRLAAARLDLDGGGVGGDVVGVQDPVAAEAAAEDVMVGDVVAVGEEHERDAAELLDALEERPGGPRRVDEDVALGRRIKYEDAPYESAEA